MFVYTHDCSWGSLISQILEVRLSSEPIIPNLCFAVVIQTDFTAKYQLQGSDVVPVSIDSHSVLYSLTFNIQTRVALSF